MVFSSISFLFYFFPLTVLFYFVPSFFLSKKRGSPALRKYKNAVLCIASLLFYAWGEPVNILLMLISIVFNYALALDMGRCASEKTKKGLLISALVFNLGLLGFFKYSGFVADSLCFILGRECSYINPALPIGISFYTFQILSYVIDVFRGRTKVQGSLMNFALYVSMFPQLIAGPIVKYSDIDAALSERTETVGGAAEGIFIFLKGFAKKAVIANAAGSVYSELTAGGIGSLSASGSWASVLFFAFQLYFDFSGYSDMAIGLGRIFGFHFPQNFNFPYTAVSITDFWRRWHITLSSWFRDYVYIPLGGSRVSAPRQLFNLFAVWALTGLWHGAAWNFVLWGIYYFVLLALEKFVFRNILDGLPVFVRRILTFVLVLFGWVLFTCENIADIGLYISAMLGANGLFDKASLYTVADNAALLFAAGILSTPLFSFEEEKDESLNRLLLRYAAGLLMFAFGAVCLIGDKFNPFLYFRF